MDEFDALLYGPPSVAFVNYAKTSMRQVVNTVNDGVRGMVKDSSNFFRDKYTSKKAIDRIKDSYLRAGQATNLDVITYMVDPTYSKPVMQRYIMSHPTIYQATKDQYISGFNDTLKLDDRVDPMEDEDYCNAMSGWLQTDSLNDYPVEYISPQSELSIGEQMAIHDTWDMCHLMMADDLDPTEGQR